MDEGETHRRFKGGERRMSNDQPKIFYGENIKETHIDPDPTLLDTLLIIDNEGESYQLPVKELQKLLLFFEFDIEHRQGRDYLKIPDFVHFSVQYKGGRSLAPIQEKQMNKVLKIASHIEQINYYLTNLEDDDARNGNELPNVKNYTTPAKFHVQDIQKLLEELTNLIK
jgi:hypothetical protein